ncbi:MAG: phosphatidylserine/phosphatidylglycerophosphate/cardiolipin synthase family protein [Planctomycetota bacterium]
MVLVLGLLQARANDAATTVIFAPTYQLKTFKAIAAELRAAQDTIDVAMFLFSEHELAEELADAKQRGVTVRVITDTGMAKLGSSRDEWLAYRGIPVKRFGQGTAMGAKFHHKFAVIDGKTVITGSLNWANDTETWNYENTVFIRDTTIARAFAKEFDSLFKTGQGNVGSTTDVLFAPTGYSESLERKIVNEANKAQSEIVVAIYLFTSWDIQKGLASALDRGVKVSILCDWRQLEYSSEVINSLKARGARVKIVRLSGSGILAEKFHQKYAVIDGKTVVMGSYNWAPNQDKYGWDNLVILRDPSLAQKYIQNFAATWSSNVAH